MRWKKRNKVQQEYAKDDDIRVITKFLFLPKHINNEYRWLELARIKQEYRGIYIWSGNIVKGHWIEKSWVDV